MSATYEETKIGSEHLFLTPKVPQGLAAAVEGLTREVIRQRPENIYAFAAQHFEKLLQLREQYALGPSVEESCEERNRRIINGLSEAIKERQERQNARARRANNGQCPNHHPGWSLNETAKVLERHRSIFGDAGQKISTEQVRELANKSENLTSSKIGEHNECKKTKSSKLISKTESKTKGRIREEKPNVAIPKNLESEESSGSGRCETKGTPRIISQIPLTKDIKTELKKHRRSSRERKKNDERRIQVSRDKRETVDENAVTKKSVEKTKSLEIIRSEQGRRSSRSESISIKKTTDVVTIKDKTSKSSPRVKKSPTNTNSTPSRTTNMDRVKNYTLQTFAGMDSIEELQSPSYVEKVQEVINETSTIIKEKVEALKTDFVKVSKIKHSKRERSSTRNDENNSSSTRRSEKSSSSLTDEKVDRQASNSRETLLLSSPSTSSSSSSSTSSSNHRNSNKNTDHQKTNLKTSKTVPTETINTTEHQQQNETKNHHSDNSDSSNDSKISLPAVRPTSSKSTSRSLSARSDSDGLVLPPISPESAKLTKVKEELVLPILSPPHSSAVTPDSLNSEVVKVTQNAKVPDEEEFHDSLNVTPDLLDDQQRPDSLETVDIFDKMNLSSGHNSPVETLKDKLLEIEDVQKRIEGVLDDTVTNKNEQSDKVISNNDNLIIHDKLLEIQESEKRIEQILDSQSINNTGQTEDTTQNVDIKKKLEELEDAEKRIKHIFDVKNEELAKNGKEDDKIQVDKESKNNDSTVPKNNDSNGKQGSGNENSNKNLDVNVNRDNGKKTDEKFEQRNQTLSPHSYILTEGSPYEIPDTVTTVIIPDRVSSPDSDILQSESENEQIYSTLMKSSKELEEERRHSIHYTFGEAVDMEITKTLTSDIDYVSTSKNGRDKRGSRSDLDLIKEERDREIDEEKIIDSEDERVLKVVTKSLEDILDKPVEYVSKKDIEINIKNNIQSDNVDDNLPKTADSIKSPSSDKTKDADNVNDKIVEIADSNSSIIEDTTAKLSESSDDIKETSIASDRSSSMLDFSMPLVPELNLDSLPDVTLSSLDEQKDDKKDDKLTHSTESSRKTATIEDTLLINDNESNQTEVKISEKNKSLDQVSQDNEKKEESVSEIKKETSTAEIDKTTVETAEKSESQEETRKEIVKEVKEKEVIDTKEESSVQSDTNVISSDNEKKDPLPSPKTKDELKEQTTTTITTTTTIQDNKLIEVCSSSIDQAEISSNKLTESTVISQTNNKISEEIEEEEEEERKKEQTTSESSVFTNENKLLLKETNVTESLSREFENNKRISIDDQTDHRDVNEENNRQLIKSGDSTTSISAGSCQCTTTTITKQQVESNDEISIEANTEESFARNANTCHETVMKQDVDKESEKNDRDNDDDGIKKLDDKQESRDDHDDKSNRQLMEDQLDVKKDQDKQMEMKEDKKESQLSLESNLMFLSAVTKIQAGIRGFLARRRIRNSQCRSSTLDSVPSIQESFIAAGSSEQIDDDAGETTDSARSESTRTNLLSIVKIARSITDLRKRKKLRREDALRSATQSLEKTAFADNQIQHTGEFHDCIPLPVFDLKLKTSLPRSKPTTDNNNTSVKHESNHREKRSFPGSSETQQMRNNDTSEMLPQAETTASEVEQLLSKILLGHAAAAATSANFANQTKLGQFVDVVLLPNDPEVMLQSGYLNFITSVEDVTNDLFAEGLIPPDTPKGVIIEEITSLDEENINRLEDPSDVSVSKTTTASLRQSSSCYDDRVAEKIDLQADIDKGMNEKVTKTKKDCDIDDLSILDLENASGQFTESSISDIHDRLLMDVERDLIEACGSGNTNKKNETLVKSTVSHNSETKLDDDVSMKGHREDEQISQSIKSTIQDTSPKENPKTDGNLTDIKDGNSDKNMTVKDEQKNDK